MWAFYAFQENYEPDPFPKMNAIEGENWWKTKGWSRSGESLKKRPRIECSNCISEEDARPMQVTFLFFRRRSTKQSCGSNLESRGVRKELDNNQRWIFVAIGKGLITTNVSKNNEIFAFPADDPSSHFADKFFLKFRVMKSPNISLRFRAASELTQPLHLCRTAKDSGTAYWLLFKFSRKKSNWNSGKTANHSQSRSDELNLAVGSTHG